MLASLRIPKPAALMGFLQMSQPLDFADETASLRPAIRALVARVLGLSREHPDVDDCTNDVYRRALEGRDRLEPGRPVRPWLLGIARHAAIDAGRARQRSRRRAAPDLGEPDSSRTPLLDTLPHPAPGPEAHTAQGELAARVGQALQGLTEDQKEALLLFHIEGLGYREISERLGVPVGTVGTWVLRGRRTLAECLREAES